MRDRDVRSARMRNTWRKMRDLGLGITLAEELPEMPVQMDHLGLALASIHVQTSPSPVAGIVGRLEVLQNISYRYTAIRVIKGTNSHYRELFELC